MKEILVSQWKAKGAMAEHLVKMKEKHGTLTAYIRSLIVKDMEI